MAISIRSERERQYQDMRAKVLAMKDRLGTPVDPGMIEIVTYLNLLGIPTVQSCDGHLDHGCAYPWVMAESDLSRRFVKKWAEVCDLEERATENGTQEAYERYIVAALDLDIQVKQWEEEDEPYQRLTGLLEEFYAVRNVLVDRLVVTRMHPGLIRLEPGFSRYAKKIPISLKQTFLIQARQEIEMFLLFLKDYCL